MVQEFKSKRKKREFEWDFILGFLALLILWLLVGHPLLFNLANGAPMFSETTPTNPTPHPLIAYGIFVVIYITMFFFLGQSFHKGFIAAGLGLLGYFLIDIWSPPIMVFSGLLLAKPTLVALGSICLFGSIIFFIIANRLEIPYRFFIFGGFILLGIMLLVLGVKYIGDPFALTQCSAITQPPAMHCIDSGGYAVLPGNLALSTDAFFYLFFRNIIGIHHVIAWILTYLFLPVIAIVTFAYFLTRKQIGKATVDGFTS